ncbi:MAG: hypothetical protein K6B75_06820 [Lachnospiraceae bacterium]|nr:hypothetical protein [Lachnospiraceae bacterium]
MVTFICGLLMMLGLMLMLLAAVGFIQDKKMFTSAPKEVCEAILPKPERFKGQHFLGWVIMMIAFLCFIAALLFGALDGIQNGLSFVSMFLRFLIMMLMVKAFDICFFDWFLLCRSGFFPHYFPEVKPLLGPHLFGFNAKSHLLQILVFIPASLALAGICMLF